MSVFVGAVEAVVDPMADLVRNQHGEYNNSEKACHIVDRQAHECVPVEEKKQVSLKVGFLIRVPACPVLPVLELPPRFLEKRSTQNVESTYKSPSIDNGESPKVAHQGEHKASPRNAIVAGVVELVLNVHNVAPRVQRASASLINEAEGAHGHGHDDAPHLDKKPLDVRKSSPEGCFVLREVHAVEGEVFFVVRRDRVVEAQKGENEEHYGGGLLEMVLFEFCLCKHGKA